MKKLGKIFIEVDGELINVVDLEKEEYEKFLEIVKIFSALYYVLR